MLAILILLALVGHGFLWAAFFNLTHSTALPRWIVSPSTAVGFACTVLIPVGFAVWLAGGGLGGMASLASPSSPANMPTLREGVPPVDWLGQCYLGLCVIAGVVTTLRWTWRSVLRPTPDVLRYDRTTVCHPLRSSGSSSEKDDHPFLLRFPGNQILELELSERALEVPRLAPPLDRLVIVHLSDLHLTGKVDKRYFQQVVRLTNELDPDLVAITGDLADHSRYIDWIPDTLGRLTSRWGTYFVLGNHDGWIDTDRLRRTLTAAGLVDLGGRWLEVAVRGVPVILAGNELPWLAPAADLQHAPPPSLDGGPLRIALAHCPDQLHWARESHVDLLLAGHTHGGQICFPLVGPLLSASRLGAAYCWGTFHLPPTIMHVTRGVSARFPVRINCRSQLVKLVLRVPLPQKL